MYFLIASEFYFHQIIQAYENIENEHPQIEQDVPQKEIAEYLQIDPITLCRIRKELLKL